MADETNPDNAGGEPGQDQHEDPHAASLQSDSAADGNQPATSGEGATEGQEQEDRPEGEGQAAPAEDEKDQSEWPPYCDPAYVMPDVILVTASDLDGNMRRFQVSVSKHTEHKAYLGGYRHKHNGLVYHHASSQTVEGLSRRRGWTNSENKAHRDTQTYEVKTRSQMTTREYGTQMQRPDLNVDEAADVVKISKPYFTSGQMADLRRRKALVVQCYYRGYLARRRVWGMREEAYHRYMRKQAQEQERIQAQQQEEEKARERRLHPRTAKDFEILYGELEEWVQGEVKALQSLTLSSIKSELQADRHTGKQDTTSLSTGSESASGAPVPVPTSPRALTRLKKERMAEILAKQTKALQRIDQLKKQALVEGREKRVKVMMQRMSEPKKWELSNGEVQAVHTPFTLRAAELSSLYQALTCPPDQLVGTANRHTDTNAGMQEELGLSATFPYGPADLQDGEQARLQEEEHAGGGETKTPASSPVDARLEVLLQVKWTVREFDATLTRDIVSLCDREADLMRRGRSDESLAGLRKRLANLFLQFVETPDFNPEATRFQSVPPKGLNGSRIMSTTM